MLETIGCEFVTIEEEMSREEKDKVISTWMKEAAGEMKILLVTDNGFIKSNVKCVQQLIHYSLSDKWSTFSERFAVMHDQFMKFVHGDKENGATNTVIMLDNNNAKKIPQLIVLKKV
jgi:hypothetical protein